MFENILIIFFFAVILLLLLLFKRRGEGGGAVDNSALFTQLDRFERALNDDFSRQREDVLLSAKSNREEIGNLFKNFGEGVSKNILDFSNSQKEKMEVLENRQAKMKADIEILLEKICAVIEKNLKNINEENTKKLDEMRKTVDEKLQATLEKRISESFNQVGERLKQVYEGLGAMQSLAAGVGDLKKVLSNVKSRGVLGEIQLGAILENILSPTQYEKNVRVKSGTTESVEFAVKLPNPDKDGNSSPVYLPLDSKFPAERYHKLLEAYDGGEPESVAREMKNLENEIRRCAKEIKGKYINPPETTDFAIMFLPFEGLYAEVVRNTVLVETLQREYKVSITGPSTLAAFLNCVQMGFRTVAIQQRTTEVWTILGSVKTEFKKFEELLYKARERITKAGNDLDELAGKRTRKIQASLKSVDELPEPSATIRIENSSDENDPAD